MTAVFVIVLGAVVVLAFLATVNVLFENGDPHPEQMSSRWLARYRELEHEDEER